MKDHALILRQLAKAKRETETQLDGIRTAIAALQNRPTGRRRELSAAARAKIGAAQRKRWKVFHQTQKAA